MLRADAEAGTRTDKLIRTADRLTKIFNELGLPDQAKLARLIAIESTPDPAWLVGPGRYRLFLLRNRSICGFTAGWSGPGWPSLAATGRPAIARPGLGWRN